ncbi:E3 ubiquitin-protein ligase RLIM-like [Heracleum sosnowskyi]|uniref:E3 ubiquitin-protein ligase RLIM-like n=1 Tax=Heracleum sosnowskyi TaxID=360622 RepID=A0AAD8IQN9_9APIA|nr:E3 ubiquitin-protein ligase RLIM-like [Heracleum sosnowskyi]
MGSSSSRLGSRHHGTPRRPKHSRLLSVLVCGGASSSHSSTLQMDDDPAEVLMTSAQCRNPVSGKFQRSKKESVVSEAEHGFSIPHIEQPSSSEADFRGTENSPANDNSGSVETNNHRKALCRSKDDCRFRDIASTSFEDWLPSGPIPANGRDDLDAASSVDDILDRNLPRSCSVVTQGISDSCSDGLSIENHASELTAIHDFDSGSVSAASDFPIDFDMQTNDTQDATAFSVGFSVSDGEQVLRDESLLHLDVLSLSPNTQSNSGADNSNHEARHSSRRLFWDAFSRRSSRRRSDSRTLVFASEDSDDLGSQDRWLFDFNGEYFDDGVGGGTGTLGSRTSSLNEHHWHSNSEIWERLHSGRRWSDRRSNICPSGRHPNGTCSCESVLMADESGAHASISRIVMLAEALFEVLDEIHRQPLSLSLPIVSLPASESIVDSLPSKNHRKTHTTDDDEEQCYICLAEYEDGDKIRILPCHHEYHMICVDKWLKEIHGVCPLCRGDVREMDTSASNTEIPSL